MSLAVQTPSTPAVARAPEILQHYNLLANNSEIFRLGTEGPKLAVIPPFGAKSDIQRPEFRYLAGQHSIYSYNPFLLSCLNSGDEAELDRQKVTIDNLPVMQKEVEAFLSRVQADGKFSVLTNSNACSYVAQALPQRQSDISGIVMQSPAFFFNQQFLDTDLPVAGIARKFVHYSSKSMESAADNLRRCDKPLLVMLAEQDSIVDIPRTISMLEGLEDDLPISVISMPCNHFINRPAVNPYISSMYQLITDFLHDPEGFSSRAARLVAATPFRMI